MKTRQWLVALLVAMCAAPVAAQTLVTVYEHDFETAPGNEWSNRNRGYTPIGDRAYLGPFGGQPVWLDLYDLPDHCAVTVSVELFVIGSWEGSVGYNAGPDVWDMNASTPGDCCPVENLLHTTFANCDCRYQAYPDTYPGIHHPGLTGADEIDTLGYGQDSVYDLEFTFYHDEEDLRLSFAGTPNLQALSDERWGLDNIVVQIDGDSCCRAIRRLPTTYGGGVPIPVTVHVRPDPRASAWVLEEDPPASWMVAQIDNGGSLDPTTGTVKWGPFFGDQPMTVSYSVLPPPTASEDVTFSGMVTVDGEAEAVCGDSDLSSGGFHPADLDEDWSISGTEFTAYGDAWRRGEPWSVQPSPIPAVFVSLAGAIWRTGEAYSFDPTVQPPWIPDAGLAVTAGMATAAFSGSGATGREVQLTVVPASGTATWTAEDHPPVGWTVVEAPAGVFDAAAGVVRFGPYTGDAPRTLTYVIERTEDASSVGFLVGVASFDGAEVEIQGERLIAPWYSPYVQNYLE